ncbi:MAG TPA: histidine kinase dimerization/phospho-acceptor domain-containing protein [Mycobacteriales bacterium]|nr:histidine kinase dimerization/phospho-acceptor domain-containing protein [Mycobacteriales bacterium]
MELTAVAIGAAMLVAAVVVLIAARRFAERGYDKQERYRSQLFDAELSALTRLREADRVREDLVASVSHEFRTPLTAIRGSASTLAARGDKIPPESREVLLRGIVEHADRLGKLLEDMLLAASTPSSAQSSAIADVTAALSAFRLGQARPPVVLEVEPDLAAYVDSVSLDQVVQALADHVRADARRDRPVTLRAGRTGAEVVVDLLYGSSRSEAELRELFEPFGSRESAETGRPATLALYVVRRLVEAHGGRAAAGRDGDQLRVRLALRALRPTADVPVGSSV